MRDKIKVYCGNCKCLTNHKILHYAEKRLRDDESGISADGIYQIIRCDGCETISFREVWVNSEDRNPEDGSWIETVNLYPLRDEHTLAIKQFYNVPYKVRNVYREMIDACNNGLYILTAAGLRTIIEGICISESIADGPVETSTGGTNHLGRKKDLQGKIGGLYEKGLLTKTHAEILHQHRFLGNNALHTLDPPSRDELRIAIEIVEHTLENLYELVDKYQTLKFKQDRKRKKK